MTDSVAQLSYFEPILALEDHHLMVLHFTGGLRAIHTPDGWALEPIPIEGTPNLVGFLSADALRDLLIPNYILPIFYEQCGVSNGVRHSFLAPWENKKTRGWQSGSRHLVCNCRKTT